MNSTVSLQNANLPVIREQVPLAPFTSMGIGGPARYFAQVASRQELTAVIAFARHQHLPYYLLGGGTNVLVSDRGFDGLVIHLKLEAISWGEDGELVAEAGAELARVVEMAAEEGRSGLEHFAGIPGTLGGAVRGNAGAFGVACGDVVSRVEVLHGETLQWQLLERDDCSFGYRNSFFKEHPQLIVVAAALPLVPGDPTEIRRTMEAVLTRRGAAREHEKSVGSYFMNPTPDDPLIIERFERDQQTVCRNCMIPAGWFIDQAGLRGTRVGGAMVSPRHGNYLINTGTATAEEMRRLARLVQERVYQTLGVRLQEEVNYLGF